MFQTRAQCRTLLIQQHDAVKPMTRMPPHCPAWTLRAWPPLLWQVDRPVPAAWRHVGTQVTHPGDAVFRSSGQTLWAWHGEEGDLGMAWDWVEVSTGVVALADPMAVVSNMRLLGDAGEELDPLSSARHLNAIVHGLPWQDEVGQVLGPGARRSVAAPPRARATPPRRAAAHGLR